jgi:hypothetical protein
MIGCRSLTIHRVESALLTESVFGDRAGQHFDCVNELQFERIEDGITRILKSVIDRLNAQQASKL